MRRFWYFIVVISLSGCGVDFEETPTTFLSSFPNDTIEVTSNDLSNKGLVCNVRSFEPILENIGFWFVDDKRFEKWFNQNTEFKTDGFEFVQIEKNVFTSYEVDDDTITLNYSDDESSPPYEVGETINRSDLSLYYRGGRVGECIVLVGKDRFLEVLEKITKTYRKDNQTKLNKRKI